jgi:hypothetical protein
MMKIANDLIDIGVSFIKIKTWASNEALLLFLGNFINKKRPILDKICIL